MLQYCHAWIFEGMVANGHVTFINAILLACRLPGILCSMYAMLFSNVRLFIYQIRDWTQQHLNAQIAHAKERY